MHCREPRYHLNEEHYWSLHNLLVFTVSHGERKLKTNNAQFSKFLRDRGRSSLADPGRNSKAHVNEHVRGDEWAAHTFGDSPLFLRGLASLDRGADAFALLLRALLWLAKSIELNSRSFLHKKKLFWGKLVDSSIYLSSYRTLKRNRMGYLLCFPLFLREGQKIRREVSFSLSA